MTEPSVEEIVRAYETARALGLPQNYLGREYADALIADWRKRGEALAHIGIRKVVLDGEDCGMMPVTDLESWEAFEELRLAAITPQQTPPAAP